MKNDLEGGDNGDLLEGLMDLIIDIRQSARANKDWTTADQVRDKMNEHHSTDSEFDSENEFD